MALKQATGDLIVMSEPDGTFEAKDILKLLVYSDEFDVVQGTRTMQATIMKGANMGLFLQWGNWFVAKLMEILFMTTQICDAGCTYRLMTRRTYEKIKDQFTISSLEFNVELTLLYIKKQYKIHRNSRSLS